MPHGPVDRWVREQCWEFLGWVSLKSSMTFNDYIEKNLDTTVLHSHTPPLGTFSLSSITDMVPRAVAFRPRRRQENTKINYSYSQEPLTSVGIELLKVVLNCHFYKKKDVFEGLTKSSG
jgi:hypothetical protein